MKEIIHDVITNEILIRDYTPEEIAIVEQDRAQGLAEQAERHTEQASKDAAKQAVLDKLGLSADEVAALLG